MDTVDDTRPRPPSCCRSEEKCICILANPIFRRRTLVLPGKLKALEIDQDDASTLTWEKGIRGILFQKREKPYDVEVKTVSGSVETSLLEDGRKAGVQSALLSQLADIFTWDIDLEKEIHEGDTFKILYEQRSRKGQETKSTTTHPGSRVDQCRAKTDGNLFRKATRPRKLL